MKYNIISHITTSCNYNCSYCDVVKGGENISNQDLEKLVLFIKNNSDNIDRFKFFGGEPLLAFNNIKFIVDSVKDNIGNNFEIVTNTTILNDKIGEYFNKYFKLIFFSIDTENKFDYDRVFKFIKKFDLEKKLYFNLVISPGKERESLKQFKKLYSLGFRGFNILPVYFTKKWSKNDLESLSSIMKYILDLSLEDNTMRLYGFRENKGKDTSLANNTFFIDTDLKVYFSDIVSTFKGSKIKNNILLGYIDDISLSDFDTYGFGKEKSIISLLEKDIYNNVDGQKQLHKIMDYFSEYLNKKNG